MLRVPRGHSRKKCKEDTGVFHSIITFRNILEPGSKAICYFIRLILGAVGRYQYGIHLFQHCLLIQFQQQADCLCPPQRIRGRCSLRKRTPYPSTKSQSFSFIHVFYSSFSKSLGHSQEILRPCGRLRMKTYRTHSDTPFLRTTRFLRLRHLKTCNL